MDTGEPYARAVAALNTDHPRTLPELGRAVGARPSVCELANAICECTWRFVADKGAQQIVATASFVDERAAEPESVPMIARGDLTVEVLPDEAERGYRAGSYEAPKNVRLPVANAGGELSVIESGGLTSFLNAGGHLTSWRAWKAAELESKYASWTELQRTEACTAQPAPVRQVKLEGKVISW